MRRVKPSWLMMFGDVRDAHVGELAERDLTGQRCVDRQLLDVGEVLAHGGRASRRATS